jgi:Asp/Glu/hydantoin racemase
MICLPKGPVSVENATNEARAIPYILDEIKRAEQKRYDAVTNDCTMDSLPLTIKEAAKIPVVIGEEVSRRFATAFGDKFSELGFRVQLKLSDTM